MILRRREVIKIHIIIFIVVAVCIVLYSLVKRNSTTSKYQYDEPDPPSESHYVEPHKMVNQTPTVEWSEPKIRYTSEVYDVLNLTPNGKQGDTEYYNFPTSSIGAVTKNIPLVQQYMQSAHDVVNEFPCYDIIGFMFKGKDKATFNWHPYTKTGKIAKFPYSIYFVTILPGADASDRLNADKSAFGTIFFNRDDTPGKIRLICWKNSYCYESRGIFRNGEPIVNRIDRTSPIPGTPRICLFNRNEK